MIWLALSLLCACAAGPRRPSSPVLRAVTPVTPSRPAAEDATARVLQTLQQIETRCWIEGDAQPYLELVAPDAALVAARGAGPGPYDVHFSKAAFEALLRNQCAQPVRGPFVVASPSLKVESLQAHTTAEGVVVELVRAFQGFSTLERVQERFVFDARGGALRIRSLWYYPLSAKALGDPRFDVSRLAELDAKAEQTVKPMDRAHALLSALRYAEASELFCHLARAPNADAESWLDCAHSSLLAAQPERAREAFSTASRLDPLLVVKP